MTGNCKREGRTTIVAELEIDVTNRSNSRLATRQMLRLHAESHLAHIIVSSFHPLRRLLTDLLQAAAASLAAWLSSSTGKWQWSGGERRRG